MDYDGNEFPTNIGVHLAFNFKGAYLFIERIEKLLAGCGTGEGGASFCVPPNLRRSAKPSGFC